jgi:hypothetical protein
MAYYVNTMYIKDDYELEDRINQTETVLGRKFVSAQLLISEHFKTDDGIPVTIISKDAE